MRETRLYGAMKRIFSGVLKHERKVSSRESLQTSDHTQRFTILCDLLVVHSSSRSSKPLCFKSNNDFDDVELVNDAVGNDLQHQLREWHIIASIHDQYGENVDGFSSW